MNNQFEITPQQRADAALFRRPHGALGRPGLQWRRRRARPSVPATLFLSTLPTSPGADHGVAY